MDTRNISCFSDLPQLGNDAETVMAMRRVVLSPVTCALTMMNTYLSKRALITILHASLHGAPAAGSHGNGHYATTLAHWRAELWRAIAWVGISLGDGSSYLTAASILAQG